MEYPMYYIKKVEVVMKNEFKAGDLVFELTAKGEVLLSKLGYSANKIACISTGTAAYTTQGINEQLKASRLFHATPENRIALTTLYGEDNVPELPLQGSELTRKLLENQKYVLCVVSHISDDKARSNNPPKVRTVTGIDGDSFDSTSGILAEFAVPIDNNGDEITEIESC